VSSGEARRRIEGSFRRGIAVSALLGALLSRTLLQIHGAHFEALVRTAQSIWDRTPYSSALQARLFGPALVELVAAASGRGFAASYEVVFVALVFGAVGTMTFALGQYAGGARSGPAYAAVGALGIVLLQDDRWLHLWDVIDVIFAALFARAIFTNAPLAHFAVLFLVFLPNRESALFVPAWLIVSALAGDRLAPGRARDERRLAMGVVGIVAGLGALAATRAVLYRGAPAPRRPVTPWGNHFTALHNAFDLMRTLRSLDLRALTTYASLLAAAVFVVRSRSSLPRCARRVPVLMLGMALSIVLFGVVLETRSWLLFVPFLLFIAAARAVGPSREDGPRPLECSPRRQGHEVVANADQRVS
jgi:hypothetical protein